MGFRSDQKTISVKQLFSLLSEVRSKPEMAMQIPGLFEGLASQGKLAHLSVDSHQITPMSLNTLKRVADGHVKNGFFAIDQLRQDCLLAIARAAEASTPPKKDTRESLRIKNKQEGEKNTQLREDLMFMTDRLLAALNLAERCASTGDESTRALFRRECSEILASLGLKSCGTSARREYERQRSETT